MRTMTAEISVPLNAGGSTLIGQAELNATFLGKWGIPAVENGGYRRTASSLGQHCIEDGGDILMTTHKNDVRGFAIIDPPAQFTTSSNPNDVPEGSLVIWGEVPQPPNEPNDQGTRMPGVLRDNGRLRFCEKAFYATSGVDHATQGVWDGSVSGLYRVSGVHHNKAGGYLGYKPADLPRDYLCGALGGPGTSSQSKGPCLYLVSEDTSIPVGDYLAVDTLLEYSDENWPLYNQLTTCRGVAWIENSTYRGVLFAMMQATGTIWYGDPVEGSLVDPYGGYKGYHSDEYQQQLWVYEPQDLRDVLAGTKQPHEPQPINIINLQQYEVRDYRIGETSACYRDGRLTVALSRGHEPDQYSDCPLMLEFDFGGA